MIMMGKVEEGMAQLRQGIASQRSGGKRCYLPVTLGLLAKAQAATGRYEAGLITLTEALSLVEETDERHWEPELYRLRGELLLSQGNLGKASLQAEHAIQHAERSFHYAIEVARSQRARSLELRATTSLARLWQAQGKVTEARQELAAIYDWFTEGFDMADLKEARALLEELA